MYTLYFSPGACSLAIHTILNHLGLKPNVVFSGSVKNFEEINSAKMVPVLKDGDKYLTEGAAITLHLLNKHENTLMPKSEALRHQVIENMMMANATVHPAYGRMFFASNNMQDGETKNAFIQSAADAINAIWATIEGKFGEGPYLGGETVTPADILLTVYSRWGQFFPVNIEIGPKAQRMISHVLASDEFKNALEKETEEAARYGA